MEAPTTAEEIRRVNAKYHDVAADGYDAKWGIDFGADDQRHVVAKLRKIVGPRIDGRYDRALEIGAGTGYFSLNLVQAGVIGEATCTDISSGMVAALEANAATLGVPVATAVADAEELPFDSGTFDLVLGHAILHHLPDLDRAFREFHRVLRPGGTVVFAGEPSRFGDRLARVPKRGAATVAPLWRRAIRARPAGAAGNGDGHHEDHALERFVDIHAFAPTDLAAAAETAGFAEVTVRGEELTANWFGWTNRVLEATAEPDDIPWAWRQYAYRGYLLFQKLDETLLEGRLPPALFYNLLIAGRKPG